MDDVDPKATNRPSALMSGRSLYPSILVEEPLMLASSVTLVARTRTKMSDVSLLSPATRLSALVRNTTCPPSPAMRAPLALSLPEAPPAPEARLTSVEVAALRLRALSLRIALRSPSLWPFC